MVLGVVLEQFPSGKFTEIELENPLPFSGFSGFLDFSEADVPVFFVFWVVFVKILRIPLSFKAFWTGPSLARVHLPMHFIDFLEFIEFP